MKDPTKQSNSDKQRGRCLTQGGKQAGRLALLARRCVVPALPSPLQQRQLQVAESTGRGQATAHTPRAFIATEGPKDRPCNLSALRTDNGIPFTSLTLDLAETQSPSAECCRLLLASYYWEGDVSSSGDFLTDILLIHRRCQADPHRDITPSTDETHTGTNPLSLEHPCSPLSLWACLSISINPRCKAWQ